MALCTRERWGRSSHTQNQPLRVTSFKTDDKPSRRKPRNIKETLFLLN